MLYAEITVKTERTEFRYEREFTIDSRRGRSASARFKDWLKQHSTPETGNPTPYTTSDDKRGIAYLPPH